MNEMEFGPIQEQELNIWDLLHIKRNSVFVHLSTSKNELHAHSCSCPKELDSDHYKTNFFLAPPISAHANSNSGK